MPSERIRQRIDRLRREHERRRVYLAHDRRFNRGVAFRTIRAEGLDYRPVHRSSARLLDTQPFKSRWEEDQLNGTGFLIDFTLKYHLRRSYWPVRALGRYRRLCKGRPIHLPATAPWN